MTTIFPNRYRSVLRVIVLVLTLAAAGASQTVEAAGNCSFDSSIGAYSCAPVAAGTSQSTPTRNPMSAATVTITDAGFSPSSILLANGGTVTWVNQGAQVYSATTLPNQSMSFDSGGLDVGQTFSFNFTSPGVYKYTSAPHCLNGSYPGLFPCATTFVVTVV